MPHMQGGCLSAIALLCGKRSNAVDAVRSENPMGFNFWKVIMAQCIMINIISIETKI